MRRRTLVSALLLLVASTAVGCSLIPKDLDMGGLEAQLASQLNTDLETTGTTVSCPDDVKAETGEVFDCTATLATGETILLRLTQTDRDGHVTYVFVDPATPSPSA